MKIITFKQLRHRWGLYLLILPALAFVVTFSYLPALSGVYHSMYRWDGDDIEQWVGMKNFVEAVQDEQLHYGFKIVLVFIFANLFKMIPSIITAVMIHRMVSAKSRYIYRVLFVIPMIIPMMVWLLLWKFFYNPMYGPLNKILNATGAMHVLVGLNHATYGLPAIARVLTPFRNWLTGPLFGGVFGLLTVGAAVLALSYRKKGAAPKEGLIFKIVLFLVIGVFATGFIGSINTTYELAAGDTEFEETLVDWHLPGATIFTPGKELVTHADEDGKEVEPNAYTWLVDTIGEDDAAWFTAPVHVPRWVFGYTGMAVLCLAMFATIALRGGAKGQKTLKRVGIVLLIVGAVLVAATMIWPEKTDALESYGDQAPQPAWLAHPDLILFAFMFWGFPWVGVVSVLLYLAGLGNIDQSTYDAAEIDGCGWFRKFWNIELPLITTQVRLNLILMCIYTLKGWGLAFILFGDSGGPGGKVMLPGLYMFRNAFSEPRAGYACAIGLLLFFLIVVLTWINNRYVRVSK